MKLFLDTADVKSVKARLSTGLISGITTNPTLIFKSGKHPQTVYQELIKLGIDDISMEVIGETSEEFFERGINLTKEFGVVATIKLPCSEAGITACKRLTDLGVRVNVTLIFSVSQAILASLAGATYISPFIGRLDDNSIAGLQLIKDIDEVYRVQAIHRTRILSASIRYVNSVSQSFANGADIVTMPPAVFDKMYNHVLTDKGLEIFENDWKSTQTV